MNFVKSSKDQKPRLIKHGDLVIIYERHDSLDHLYVHKGKIYSNRFGTFYHDDMINRPFGIKVKSRSTDGWVYILEPNPELWSTALHVRNCYLDYRFV
jgi:tRNA (adenine57-N1/adenine58-N1)-methyltransferase